MADYIDRENIDISGKGFKNYDDYSHFIDLINEQPSADVVEVVHGHWIKTVYAGYKCEICGHIEDVVDDFEQPLYEDFADFCENNRYCRICGAKMRGLKKMKQQICGTCQWHKYAGDGWVCVNSDSDYCADYTEYNDTCEEWEER